MKKCLTILSLLVLIGCGGSSTEIKILNQFVGSNETIVVNNSEDYDKTRLGITGSNSTITIESDLVQLIVPGSNNTIHLLSTVRVEECIIEGNDNNMLKEELPFLDCDDTGMGNIGFE